MTVLLRKVRGKCVPLLRVDQQSFSFGQSSGGSLGSFLSRSLPALAVAVLLLAALTFGHFGGGGLHALSLVGMIPLGTSVVPTGGQQDRRTPFRFGSRWRGPRRVDAVPFVPGQPIRPITLPQVGYLEKIYLKLEGSVSFTGGGDHFDAFGISSMFKRITVDLNNGTTSIVNISGRGLEIYNAMMSPQGAAPIVAQTAAAVNYGLVIPINANDRELLELGLINLQAEQVRCTVNITPATAAEFSDGTAVTSTDLTLYVYYKYWDVPDPRVVQQPPVSIVRLLEEGPFSIDRTGDHIYVLPRLGTLAQLAEYFINDSAPMNISSAAAGITPDVTRWQLMANKTDQLIDQETRVAEIEEAMFNNTGGTSLLGSFLREGTLVHDFFHSAQQWRMQGGRDMIDTEQITTLESIATIDSGVTLVDAQRFEVRRLFGKVVGGGL